MRKNIVHIGVGRVNLTFSRGPKGEVSILADYPIHTANEEARISNFVELKEEKEWLESLFGADDGQNDDDWVEVTPRQACSVLGAFGPIERQVRDYGEDDWTGGTLVTASQKEGIRPFSLESDELLDGGWTYCRIRKDLTEKGEPNTPGRTDS